MKNLIGLTVLAILLTACGTPAVETITVNPNIAIHEFLTEFVSIVDEVVGITNGDASPSSIATQLNPLREHLAGLIAPTGYDEVQSEYWLYLDWLIASCSAAAVADWDWAMKQVKMANEHQDEAFRLLNLQQYRHPSEVSK